MVFTFLHSFRVSVMSVMSVTKKSKNSEGQIVKYCKILSVRKQGESITLKSLLFVLSMYLFLVQRNFAKKG